MLSMVKKTIFMLATRWVFFLGLVLNCAAANAEDPKDIRVLIDISGSMLENDPNNLRVPALELLIDLLPEGSKAGVWTFGQYVNMLVPYGDVDNQWKQTARVQAKKINSLGQRTNLGGALEQSAFDFDYSDANWQKHFIVLTDGKVDISPQTNTNIFERNRVINEVLPKYMDREAILHTISLSDNADFPLLNHLATQTGGISETVKKADDLMQVFLKAFDFAVPSEQVPLANNGFSVDNLVQEFTALIFRKPLSQPISLIAPDGTEITSGDEIENMKWLSTDSYDMITISNPNSGAWQIQGEILDESRISIVSDLSLKINRLMTMAFEGEAVNFSAFMNAKEGKVEDQAFLDLMNLNVTLIDESGNVDFANPVEKGSDFNFEIGNQLDNFGNYQVVVNLDGRTFQRQLSRTLSYQPQFSIEAAPQEDFYLIRLFVNNPKIDKSAIKLKALVTAPDGSVVNADYSDFNNPGGFATLMLSAEQGLGTYLLATELVEPESLSNQSSMVIPTLSLAFPFEGLEALVPEKDEAIAEAEPMMVEELEVEPEPQVFYPKFPVLTYREADPADQLPVAEEEPPLLEPQELVFEELEGWEDEIPEEESGDSLGLVTILLLSIPGIAILIGGYFAFRYFEKLRMTNPDYDSLAIDSNTESATDKGDQTPMREPEFPDFLSEEEAADTELADLEDVQESSLEDLEEGLESEPEKPDTELEDEDEVFDLGDLSDLTDLPDEQK